MKEIYKLVRSKLNPGSVLELSWVFAGQAATVILSFVIIKILSGMGPKDYGIYALVITIAVFIGLSFYGPVAQGFIRFYYYYLEKSLSRIFTGFIFRILIISSSIFLFLTLVLAFIKSFFILPEPTMFFLFAGIYIITSKVSEFFNSVLNLIRKRKENSILQGMEKSFIIIFLVLLMYLKALILTNVFVILASVTLVFAVVKIIVFNKYLPLEEKRETGFAKSAQSEMRIRMFQYVSPFFIWGFSAWLQLNGEKWIINGLLSTYDVGIYAIMMALVNALVIVPNNIISDFATPIIFQQYSDMDNSEKMNTGHHYIRLNMLVIFLLTLFSTIITYFWGRELIILISNKSYTVYWYLLPLLSFGTGMFLTGQAQTVFGLALNQPKKYLMPKVIIGIFAIMLNIILIKYEGINGVAITVLLIGVIYFFYIAFVNKKIKHGFST